MCDFFLMVRLKTKCVKRNYSIKSILVQIFLGTDKPVPDFTWVGRKVKRQLFL